MRFLLPLLLITINSFAQKDTILSWDSKITVWTWKVPKDVTIHQATPENSDSVVMSVDTLNLYGSFLNIAVYYTDSLLIIGRDTLEICDWEIHKERSETSVIRLWLQIKTGGEPMPVEGLLFKDFLNLKYPEINYLNKEEIYSLAIKRKGVSN